MTVIYIDAVFARNAATDCFLILMTARLAGICPWRRAYLLAALAGGIYAAAAVLPACAFLHAAPVRCAAGVGVALLAFGHEARLARLTVLFFAVSCAFAGCVLALELLSGRESLPAAAAVFYAVAGLCFRAAARRHTEGTLLRVRVCLRGRTADLTALRDSGNGLRECGRSVMVVAPGSLDAALPADLRVLLTPEHLRCPPELLEPLMARWPGLRPRLAPYHTVGVPSGLLLTIGSDWTEVGGIRYPRLRLALSPTRLGDGFQALWGGEAEEPGEPGKEGTTCENFGPVPPAARQTGGRSGSPLHRRQ